MYSRRILRFQSQNRTYKESNATRLEIAVAGEYFQYPVDKRFENNENCAFLSWGGDLTRLRCRGGPKSGEETGRK
jgi:hypothetical protein